VDPTESEKEVVPGTVANSGPPEATEKTAASLPRSVDPVAVGGAVGGMTVGEAIGGAIGGVIGAVAGPGGAAIGAGLGAFAGTSIGAKLGYDVTHEIVHPEDVDPNASLKARAQAVARSTAGRAGDAGENAGQEGGNRDGEASQLGVSLYLETQESHRDASGRGKDRESARTLKPGSRAGLRLRTVPCDPDLLGFPERVGNDRAPRRVLIS